MGDGRDTINIQTRFNLSSLKGVAKTLSSPQTITVFSKVLEILILSRMETNLTEISFPHINQSAFHKYTGCTDSIFATQEIIARYISDGSTVHMCLFGLQKAFNSVEFPVLLDRLFSIGVNRKTWRLIRNWYVDGACFVHVDGTSSTSSLLKEESARDQFYHQPCDGLTP